MAVTVTGAQYSLAELRLAARRSIAENRFHRPLAEITEAELLRAIRVGQQDAEQARTELTGRGWTAAHIVAHTA